MVKHDLNDGDNLHYLDENISLHSPLTWSNYGKRQEYMSCH